MSEQMSHPETESDRVQRHLASLPPAPVRYQLVLELATPDKEMIGRLNTWGWNSVDGKVFARMIRTPLIHAALVEALEELDLDQATCSFSFRVREVSAEDLKWAGIPPLAEKAPVELTVDRHVHAAKCAVDGCPISATPAPSREPMILDSGSSAKGFLFDSPGMIAILEIDKAKGDDGKYGWYFVLLPHSCDLGKVTNIFWADPRKLCPEPTGFQAGCGWCHELKSRILTLVADSFER